jgi:hypothetical protein
MLEWRDAFFLFQAKKAKTCRSCPQLTSRHFPTASHIFWAIERKFNFWISLKMYVYLCPFRSYLTHFTLGHRPWVLLGKLTEKYLKSINTLVIGSSLEPICIVWAITHLNRTRGLSCGPVKPKVSINSSHCDKHWDIHTYTHNPEDLIFRTLVGKPVLN